MKYLLSVFSLLCFVCVGQTVFAQASPEAIDVETEKQHILDSVDLLDTLNVPDSKIEVYPDIMSFFQRSSDYPEDYNPYDKFLLPQSVKRGRAFLQRNQNLLQEAADEFDIQPEVFVSFLRIESDFGEYTHTHQALGAFVSIIYFSSSQKRKSWAETQLEALLELSQRNDQNLTDIRSSYAGAIGLPQFLPTSFMAYAVDGNGDGVVDLFNLHDAVWSIGNYLTEHGWHTDKWRAVWLYNRSNRYVACVLQYTNAL